MKSTLTPSVSTATNSIREQILNPQRQHQGRVRPARHALEEISPEELREAERLAIMTVKTKNFDAGAVRQRLAPNWMRQH